MLDIFQKKSGQSWLSAGQPDHKIWLPSIFFWFSRAPGHPIYPAVSWRPVMHDTTSIELVTSYCEPPTNQRNPQPHVEIPLGEILVNGLCNT